MNLSRVLGKKQVKISLKSAIWAVFNLEIPVWKIFKKNKVK